MTKIIYFALIWNFLYLPSWFFFANVRCVSKVIWTKYLKLGLFMCHYFLKDFGFLRFFYKNSRGTRLYFKPRNLNFQESRYMCGSFCFKGLCFPCCVLMCVVCLCVLCACVVCRKCWKCFLTSCGHARNPPKDSVSPLLYHSATLKRYISISFNQIDTDSAFDYYGYSWQIPIQDFEQNLRSWNSETERYFNKICPFISPPILKDWRHLVVRLKRMTTICPVTGPL